MLKDFPKSLLEEEILYQYLGAQNDGVCSAYIMELASGKEGIDPSLLL